MTDAIMNRRRFLSSAFKAGALATGFRASAVFAQDLLQTGPSWVELNDRFAGWATVRGGTASLLRAPLDRGPGGSLSPNPPISHLSDLNVAFGPGMSAEFCRWLETSMGRPQPAAAVLAAIPASGRASRETRWTGAYVNRLRVPELDRARHDAVCLDATVRVGTASERFTRWRKAPGHLPTWRRSQFRFRISGVPLVGSELQGIGAFEFRRPLATNVLDAEHRNSVRAGDPVLPVLRLRLQGAAEYRVRKAFESPVRRTGTLELFAEQESPWLRLVFRDLALRQDADESSGTGLDLVFKSAALSCY